VPSGSYYTNSKLYTERAVKNSDLQTSYSPILTINNDKRYWTSRLCAMSRSHLETSVNTIYKFCSNMTVTINTQYSRCRSKIIQYWVRGRALETKLISSFKVENSRKKGKSAAGHRDPELIPDPGSQPAGDWSHETDGRLPGLLLHPTSEWVSRV